MSSTAGHTTQARRVADKLGVSARTVRRAVSQGTVRSGPLGLSPAEEGYLLRTWPLLSALRQALRNEPGLDAAILFGSVARGDDTAGSDVDLAVRFRRARPGDGPRLANRLERRVGRSVQVIDLAAAERDSAVLLSEIVRDGRPLVDRSGEWAALLGRRGEIEERALAEDDRSAARARAALAAFLGG